MSEEEYLKKKIDKCLGVIEATLDWGSSESWNTDDFENLSGLIEAKTGVLLSITTLKRIWGKIKYDSSPNTKTLDALTQFANLGTWRNFSKKKSVAKKRTKANTGTRILETDGVLKWGLLLFALLSVSIFYLASFKGKMKDIQRQDFAFSSHVISKGLPNSVVFNYDVQAAQETDRIELQQSWDASKRMVLTRNKKVATSIYYTPGFFKAKLVVNDQIIKEHDVYIPSEGWLGMIDGDTRPIYLSEDEIHKEGEVGIWLPSISSKNINPKVNETWTSLYNVGAIQEISVDDFVMETTIRNNYNEGINACQFVEVVLLCEGEAILARYSIPGCVAQNRLNVLDKYVDGRTEDLSSLGVELSDWVDLRWESKDNMLSFYANEQMTFQTTMSEKKNAINGIKYRFQGSGSVRALSFKGGTGEQINLLK